MEMVFPDDWDGESTCLWAVCWPNSPGFKAILYGLLEQPNQGRFWDFRTGNFLAFRSQFKPVYDYNFQLSEVIMACNDNAVAVALTAIATAINNQNARANATSQALVSACCEETVLAQGGGIFGYTEGPDGGLVPVFGTTPPESVMPGTFPEGYETEAEYLLDKCQVANLVVDGLRQTLIAWGTITSAQTGAALAILLISLIAPSILFPPAAVAAVAIAFGVMFTASSLFATMAIYIQNNRQDWVCALYNSDTAELALTTIAGLVDTALTALAVASPLNLALKTIILALLNQDTINQLFHKTAHANYPDADCSDCEEPLCCFDFPEDLQGWVATTDNPITGGGWPLGTVEWVSAGNIEVTTGDGPGYESVIIEGPSMDCVIGPAAEILWQWAASLGFSTSVRIEARIDGTWFNLLNANSAGGDTFATGDLSAYEGQTLQGIVLQHGVGTTTPFSVTYTAIGICP